MVALGTILPPLPSPPVQLISTFTYKRFRVPYSSIIQLGSPAVTLTGSFFYAGTQPRFVPKEAMNKGGVAVPIR